MPSTPASKRAAKLDDPNLDLHETNLWEIREGKMSPERLRVLSKLSVVSDVLVNESESLC